MYIHKCWVYLLAPWLGRRGREGAMIKIGSRSKSECIVSMQITTVSGHSDKGINAANFVNLCLEGEGQGQYHTTLHQVAARTHWLLLI